MIQTSKMIKNYSFLIIVLPNLPHFCKKFTQNCKKYLQNIRTHVHYAPDDNTNFGVTDFNNNADDCH
ncbi:Uncharacterised protein [Moraxella lacunata]|uniref:Uncharacterized protein n=1 Tax=Moraxella lacunata TaxID=477 RepID=A0A1B8Q3M6_MORLA|nr:hypothetical protein A9Z63_01770 [Moraxella lacunata]OBX63686.1 hypothetical protein A9309_05595 [Moraxella lacunata]STY99344.1 Uncharacterised protein [Moraxella lacunata]